MFLIRQQRVVQDTTLRRVGFIDDFAPDDHENDLGLIDGMRVDFEDIAIHPRFTAMRRVCHPPHYLSTVTIYL